MRPLSIRASVTLWFVALTTLLLVGFSATLHSSLSRTLHADLDVELRARAQTLVGFCDWDEEAGKVEFELPDELGAELGAGRAGRGLEVWTWPDHAPLHVAGEPIPPAPAPTPTTGAALPTALAMGASPPLPDERLVTLDGDAPRRLCTLIAHVAARPAEGDEPAHPGFDVQVRATESLAPVEAQLRSIGWLIVALVAVTVVVVVAFGLFLSRRVTRPLEQLGRAAATVRAGGRTPMPRRGSGDEVDALADVLDATFASLADAMDRQARFTADAAHELCNPIAVIRNAADVALRHERSAAEYRDFLGDVLATSDRMAAIVAALLTLARMDAGTLRSRFRDLDLRAVVAESVAALAERGTRVVVTDGAPAPLRGDAGLLRVLLDNLLANALRHAEGQPVEVAVRPDGDDHVLLSVRDHGPGVPVEARQRIFERFFRVAAPAADRRTGHAGTGLGLAIVAEVARVHAAACDVEDSEPGARFIVRFPRASGSSGARPT